MTSMTPARKGDLTPEERVMLQVAATGTGNHFLVFLLILLLFFLHSVYLNALKIGKNFL